MTEANQQSDAAAARIASRYSFSAYDLAWPVEFEREAARVREVLNETILAIHHIGSTSVPGLAAKPIIDLLPVVRSLELLDEHAAVMAAAGYRVWGECGIAGRRYFTRDRDGLRTHNLHCFAAGDPGIERHLAFSSYLRHNETACREYAELKQRVYQLHPDDIDAYNDGKNAWIKQMESVALEWYRRQTALRSET